MTQKTKSDGAHGKVHAGSSRATLESFFKSRKLRVLKEQMCDIGRRMWQRAYVDGNGGNLAVRVSEDLALCTPTLVSKGFMRPEHMCLVDLDGRQLAGTIPRTSEILMHLQIMKRQPRAVATVHGHPPCGTAFGLAGMEPPKGMISEFELFVSAAVAPYHTPGTPELGQAVAELVDQHNTILMTNHGVVCWSHVDLEDAYFKMEILEAHCQTLMAAWQLGKPLRVMTSEEVRDLLKIKQRFGYPDPRMVDL